MLADGSVVTCGDPKHGGDCMSVQDQLVNVQQIQATWYAFAAILATGFVVAWGDSDWGTAVVTAQQFKISSGMCSKVSPQKVHLPRSCPMDHWLHGVFQTLVVTAPQFKTSFTICRFC